MAQELAPVAHTTGSEPTSPAIADTRRVQFKRQLAGMPYDQQRAAVSPAASDPVQLMQAPVQMADPAPAAPAGAAPAAPAETVTPDPKDTLKSTDYATFKANLSAHASAIGMEAADKKCEEVWLAIVTKLIASREEFKKVPLADKERGFVQLSSEAFKALAADVSTVAGALAAFMDESVKNKKKWAFWSGGGAKEAAKGSGLAEVYLEGSSYGAPFEGVKNFVQGAPQLNIIVWAAFSSAYAQKAAESLEGRSFFGFVGPGAERVESVFMQVEQPTFEDLCKQKHGLSKAPPIAWYGVAITEDWKWDKAYPGAAPGFVATGGDRATCVAAANKRADEVKKQKEAREAAALNAH